MTPLMTAGREPFTGKLADAFEGGVARGVKHFEADIELWDWVPLGARASFPEVVVGAAAVARQ